jgi:hypothetical protein
MKRHHPRPTPVTLPEGPLICALCLHDHTAAPCVPTASVAPPDHPPRERMPKIRLGRPALLVVR